MKLITRKSGKKQVIEADDIPDYFTGIVEYADGAKYWFKNDKLHREDGPAIEYANGDKSWYKNDKLHREDGPACEFVNGDKIWYLNGECHREDGPAVIYSDGSKEWYKDGRRHREDGPALEYSSNNKKYWYLNGKRYSEPEFLKRTKRTNSVSRMVVEINGTIEINGKKYKLVPA